MYYSRNPANFLKKFSVYYCKISANCHGSVCSLMVLSMLDNIVFMLCTQLTLNTLDVLKQSSNIVHIIFIMLTTSATQNLSPIATSSPIYYPYNIYFSNKGIPNLSI